MIFLKKHHFWAGFSCKLGVKVKADYKGHYYWMMIPTQQEALDQCRGYTGKRRSALAQRPCWSGRLMDVLLALEKDTLSIIFFFLVEISVPFIHLTIEHQRHTWKDIHLSLGSAKILSLAAGKSASVQWWQRHQDQQWQMPRPSPGLLGVE